MYNCLFILLGLLFIPTPVLSPYISHPHLFTLLNHLFPALSPHIKCPTLSWVCSILWLPTYVATYKFCRLMHVAGYIASTVWWLIEWYVEYCIISRAACRSVNKQALLYSSDPLFALYCILVVQAYIAAWMFFGRDFLQLLHTMKTC